MARRSDHTREELLALLVDAAGEIVAGEGLPGLTARKVAAAVGYSPGTIYNVVENLDGLVVHVNAATLDRLIAAFEAVPLSGEPRRDLMAFVECYLEFEEANPKLWGALFDYDLQEGGAWPDWFLVKIDRVFQLVEAALLPLVGAGGRRQARVAIQVLWAGLHGITALARSGTLRTVAGESQWSMARNLAESYLAGLLARREGP